MKLEKPVNDNYTATVVEIKKINQLEGCDNVVGVPLLGFQAIVSKDTKIGDIGIVFVAETQLSEEYTKVNNLYRHSEKNKNKDVKGYIEDTRRVKAMKFRGHRSDALFMPLESLKFTKVKIEELKVGDSFDKLNGKDICKKYTLKKEYDRTAKNQEAKFRRVEEKFLPEHYDSENYWRNMDNIKPDRQVVVTQKLHGTSIRIGNTVVKRTLTKRDKLAQKLGVAVVEKEFAHVYGSRRAIKDPNNTDQEHFYDMDVWTIAGQKLDQDIPENFIVYGELIGWLPTGAPIQKGYTYRVPEGTDDLYVYRVAVVTNQGMLVDLGWEQVKKFCDDRALKYVPELWVGKHADFNVDDWMNKNYFKEGFKNAVPLADESPCDEGVCVRVEGIAPYILKAKSPDFLLHETKMLDQEVEDIEEQSV